MPKTTSYAFPFMVILWCLGAVLAALWLLLTIGQTLLTAPIPFDIDEAMHAIDSWEVYAALKALSPGALYRALAGQGFYPPLHSLLVAGFYLVLGPGLYASRLPTLVSFALLSLGLAGLVFHLFRRREEDAPDGRRAWLPFVVVGAAFSLLLAVTSPVMIKNAALCMLEISGALWLLPLIWLLARADEFGVSAQPRRRSRTLAFAAGVVMLAFLTKYTFGIFLGLGLALALVTRSWPWKAPRSACRALFLVTGIFVAIAVLWVLITDRTSMLLFFTDHPSYAPLLSLKNLLFYPRAWLVEYSLRPFIGLLVLLLAALEAYFHWVRLYVRLCVWSFLVALAFLTLSTTNETRHLLVVAPLLWLLAGLRLAAIFRALHERAGRDLNPALALGLLLLLFLDFAWAPAGQVRSEVVRSLEGKAYYSAMQTQVLEKVDLNAPLLLVGDFSDQNSLLAFRWLAALNARRSTWELAVDHYPFRLYAHVLLRHNRRPQAPILQPGFPETPLAAVLAQDYYHSVIVLRERARKASVLDGIDLDALLPYPFVSYRYPDWDVTVFTVLP